MIRTEFCFSIKRRSDAGQWVDLALESVAGKALDVLFQEFEGQEIVARLELAGENLYFCGTDLWIERMSRKGKAGSFTSAIEILQQRRPDLLKETLPTPAAVADLFKDARLVSFYSEAAKV
jgi:hypothetical protein